MDRLSCQQRFAAVSLQRRLLEEPLRPEPLPGSPGLRGRDKVQSRRAAPDRRWSRQSECDQERDPSKGMEPGRGRQGGLIPSHPEFGHLGFHWGDAGKGARVGRLGLGLVAPARRLAWRMSLMPPQLWLRSRAER